MFGSDRIQADHALQHLRPSTLDRMHQPVRLGDELDTTSRPLQEKPRSLQFGSQFEAPATGKGCAVEPSKEMNAAVEPEKITACAERA